MAILPAHQAIFEMDGGNHATPSGLIPLLRQAIGHQAEKAAGQVAGRRLGIPGGYALPANRPASIASRWLGSASNHAAIAKASGHWAARRFPGPFSGREDK
jgi:hypothetical protein